MGRTWSIFLQLNFEAKSKRMFWGLRNEETGARTLRLTNHHEKLARWKMTVVVHVYQAQLQFVKLLQQPGASAVHSGKLGGANGHRDYRLNIFTQEFSSYFSFLEIFVLIADTEWINIISTCCNVHLVSLSAVQRGLADNNDTIHPW